MSGESFGNLLSKLTTEAEQELDRILDYWSVTCRDLVNGGYIGRIDNCNIKDYTAPKGAVLNARILWTFSAAYNFKKKGPLLASAKFAFDYFKKHFVDKKYGGVYWSLTPNGQPLDDKKQVYAIAFAIYGVSEYFIASGEEDAKSLAISLYRSLTGNCFDNQRTGYYEAYTRDWKDIGDVRLSDKDANEQKTMNTHLHVLEAFTTLYKIWPDADLKLQITLLIRNFTDLIIDKASGHLNLFFNENWEPKSNLISYGHDIEAAWLILEAVDTIGSPNLKDKLVNFSLRLTDVASEGLDTNFAINYEYDPVTKHLIEDKHWWVQAEAVVGYLNAYKLSGNSTYLSNALGVWEFIKYRIIDYDTGEWFWGVDKNGRILTHEDKVGFWKCPYHNSRALLEVSKRVTDLRLNVIPLKASET
jgi:cellobiose epimerase